MIRHLVQILGVAFSVIGILPGIWGTYLLTHLYHPFESSDFTSTIWRFVCLFVRGDHRTIYKEARVATDFAELNPERKSHALVGVHIHRVRSAIPWSFFFGC